MTAKLEIIKGVGGYAVYINNFRVSPRNTKPLGGGETVLEANINEDDVAKAISRTIPAPVADARNEGNKT